MIDTREKMLREMCHSIGWDADLILTMMDSDQSNRHDKNVKTLYTIVENKYLHSQILARPEVLNTQTFLCTETLDKISYTFLIRIDGEFTRIYPEVFMGKTLSQEMWISTEDITKEHNNMTERRMANHTVIVRDILKSDEEEAEEFLKVRLKDEEDPFIVASALRCAYQAISSRTYTMSVGTIQLGSTDEKTCMCNSSISGTSVLQ